MVESVSPSTFDGIERIVLGELNDYIDPPHVSGITLFEDERRDLARRISAAVAGFLEVQRQAT